MTVEKLQHPKTPKLRIPAPRKTCHQSCSLSLVDMACDSVGNEGRAELKRGTPGRTRVSPILTTGGFLVYYHGRNKEDAIRSSNSLYIDRTNYRLAILYTHQLLEIQACVPGFLRVFIEPHPPLVALFSVPGRFGDSSRQSELQLLSRIYPIKARIFLLKLLAITNCILADLTPLSTKLIQPLTTLDIHKCSGIE
ncbi:hypothetical protein METSCH_D06380 [Metschnikowia aff. pulcherrima]|uniref:Uncharacterized protein n=1 Tax=Metschnikowia aff. pulcherrima TaxID=2163413 RepID=A0A4P6XU36_9ASCO|nr:hypothetical protein METSCH_D06380 [Metschnikowia aff. pulcherrima]